jgi:hypothetical protein
MKPRRRDLIDESAESEITIQPDGRIFAFGITPQLVEVLATIPMADDRARRLLERLNTCDDHATLEREEPAR